MFTNKNKGVGMVIQPHKQEVSLINNLKWYIVQMERLHV